MATVEWLVVLCLLPPAFLTASCRQTPPDPGEPVAATLENLAWMTGTWEGPGFEGRVREHWMAPDGESMAGLFRLVVAGRTRVVQIMTLVEQEPGLVLSLNHLTPRAEKWQMEDEPVRFLLGELTRNRASFACLAPRESWPEELVYRRADPETLIVEYRSGGKSTALLKLTKREE